MKGTVSPKRVDAKVEVGGGKFRKESVNNKY